MRYGCVGVGECLSACVCVADTDRPRNGLFVYLFVYMARKRDLGVAVLCMRKC